MHQIQTPYIMYLPGAQVYTFYTLAVGNSFLSALAVSPTSCLGVSAVSTLDVSRFTSLASLSLPSPGCYSNSICHRASRLKYPYAQSAMR